jgi:uncharacterized protein YuzE
VKPVKLINFLPSFASELQQTLNEMGETELASQLGEAEICECSYDAEVCAAYIRLVPLGALDAIEVGIIGVSHDRTLEVAHRFWVYIDIDNFNRITGIELLDGAEIAESLLSFSALVA